VKLVSGSGKSVSVDRAALCSASPVFRAMLTGAYVEAGAAEIDLSDASLDALHVVAHCATCGRVIPRCPAVMIEVLVLLDRYLMDTAKEDCCWFLSQAELDAEELCAAYEAALAHRAPELAFNLLVGALSRAAAGGGWTFISPNGEGRLAAVAEAFDQAATRI
jgi:hypothetical protein